VHHPSPIQAGVCDRSNPADRGDVDIESLQLLGGLSAGTDWKGQAVPARTDGIAMVPIRIQALYLSVYNHGQAATNLLDFVPHSAVGGPAMTVKIDGVEPNIFPDIEDLDARDAGRNVEVFLDVRIEGKPTPVTVKLSYEQASDLATLLEPFRKP
jgi:hypothetical protein